MVKHLRMILSLPNDLEHAKDTEGIVHLELRRIPGK